MYTLKKSLGQHFLRDENISRKIVATVVETHERLKEAAREGEDAAGHVVQGAAAEGAGPDVQEGAGAGSAITGGTAAGKSWQLLEVGPGAGALTKYLLETEGLDLKAVELDEEKVQYLQKTWPALEGKILHKSVLDMDKPFAGTFSVVGNFPYNISTQILFRMLDWKEDLEAVTGMFQKEVAQRVAAPPGNKVYGVISVLIQAFFKVEYLFEVHEQCFNPPPKVKSAVIRLIPRKDRPAFRDERSFFMLVKTAFNQRRKTLRNAVKSLFETAELEDPLFGQRAEQLSVDDFARLTWNMQGGKKPDTGTGGTPETSPE